jgi:hypothetical protein
MLEGWGGMGLARWNFEIVFVFVLAKVQQWDMLCSICV